MALPELDIARVQRWCAALAFGTVVWSPVPPGLRVTAGRTLVELGRGPLSGEELVGSRGLAIAYRSMMRFLAVPAAILAVIAAAAPPAKQAAARSDRALIGVTCPRTTSCWAVGYQTASGVTRTLIEHWNGRKWSVKASPSVAGSADALLRGVSCLARLNCWAVGSAALRSTRLEPVAEHWNGRRWSLTVLPEPAGLAADDLWGVWCPGAAGCWAVGSAARRVDAARRPLAEHWNGRKWSVVPTRAAGGFSDLLGVFCRRDTNCWAVGAGGSAAGGGLAEHWNGRKWSVAATPSTGGGLDSVWCPGTNCFATGNSGVPNAIAERWSGRKWSLTPTAPLPVGAGSTLPGASCATSANCFAVGFVNVHALIEHWQGSKWVRVKSPDPAGAGSAELQRVFCLSPRSCWAVGASDKHPFLGPASTLAEHWNGRRWSIVPTP